MGFQAVVEFGLGLILNGVKPGRKIQRLVEIEITDVDGPGTRAKAVVEATVCPTLHCCEVDELGVTLIYLHEVRLLIHDLVD